MKLIIRESNGTLREQEITEDMHITPTQGEHMYFTGVDKYTFSLTEDDTTMNVYFVTRDGETINLVLHNIAQLIQQNDPLDPFAIDTVFGVSTNEAGDKEIAEALNNTEFQSGEIIEALKAALSMDGSTQASGAVIDDFQGLLDNLEAAAAGGVGDTAYLAEEDDTTDPEPGDGDTIDEVNPESPVDAELPDEGDPTRNITEPEPEPIVAVLNIVGPDTVAEGAVAQGYRVTVDVAPQTDLIVSVVTGHITTQDGDYVPVSTTVTIPAGETESAPFDVETIDDPYADNGEQYTVSITGTTGGNYDELEIGTPSVTTTIIDDSNPNTPDTPDEPTQESAVINIEGPAVVTEGDVAQGYKLTVDIAPETDLIVSVVTGHITTQDGDYVPVSTTVTIPAGETESAPFDVTTIDDPYADNGEQYTVSITGTTGGNYEDLQIGTSSVTTTILDDDVEEVSVGATDTLVDEDDLDSGNNDSAPGDDDPVTAGTINYELPVGHTLASSGISLTIDNLNGLTTSNGEPISTTWDASSSQLIAYTGVDASNSANHVFIIDVDTQNATGTSANYTVTLLQAVEHPTAQDENNIDLTVGVQVTDSAGITGNGSFNLSIDDDMPVIQNECIVGAETGAGQSATVGADLVLMIDTSGSVSSSDLDSIHASLSTLFNSGAVHSVFLTSFASDGTFHDSGSNGGWYTDLDAALTQIDALTDGGSTDYDAALQTVTDNFTPPPAGGGQLISMFVSDGGPNQNNGTGSNGIIESDTDVGGIGEETAWINFLTANGFDESYVVGYNGLDNGSIGMLEPIAWTSGETAATYDATDTIPSDTDTDDAADDNNVVILTDIDDLTDTLNQTVAAGSSSTNGNVLDNVSIGADEVADPKLYSVSYNGETVVFDTTVTSKTFDTNAGEITINQDGSYTFTAEEAVNEDQLAHISYTVMDADGDAVSGNLCLKTIDALIVTLDGDTTVAEGASASYTVSVDKAPLEDMTVTVTYTYQTADTNDIVEGVAQVTIPAGQTSAPISVAAIDDSFAEGDELYSVVISNPSNGGFEVVEIDNDTVQTTIIDNDIEDKDVITCEDTEYVFTLNDFNTDADSVKIDSLPTSGTLLLSGVAVAVGAEITSNDIVDGNLTFMPELNESGRDEYNNPGLGDQHDDYAIFDFSILDDGLWSSSSTMTIDVSPVADTPDLEILGSTENTVTIDASNVSDTNGSYKVTAYYHYDNDNDGELDTAPISTVTNSNHDGFGVQSTIPSGENPGAATEISYHPGEGSEAVGIEFDNALTSVDVSYGWKHSYDTGDGDGEIAIVQFFKDGQLLDTQEHYDPGQTDTIDGPYTFELPDGGSFDEIRISAKQEGDDFLIHEVTYTELISSETELDVEVGNDAYFAINTALTDLDGSESFKSIVIDDLPEGFSISDGTHSFTSTSALDYVDVKDWDMDAIKLNIPDGISEGAYDIQVIATSKESLADLVTPPDGVDCPLTAEVEVPFTINVNSAVLDPEPEAVDETQELDISLCDTNLVFVLDVSGSMTDEAYGGWIDTDGDGVGDTTRLEMAKNAIIDAINSYSNNGDVNVQLTTFGNGASSTSWMSGSEAINHINNIDSSHDATQNTSTNYEAAIKSSVDNYSDIEPSAKTVTYFISDGEPTREIDDGYWNEYNTDFLDSQYVTQWTDFVNNNVDDLHVVGIGPGLSNSTYLETMAVGSYTAEYADDLAISSVISNNIDSVTGNLLDNIDWGDYEDGSEDTGSITSIEIDGVIYTVDGADSTTAFPSAGVDVTNDSGDTIGTFVFDFTSGEYTYTNTEDDPNSDYQEVMNLVATDTSGDTVEYTLTLDVNLGTCTVTNPTPPTSGDTSISDGEVLFSDDFNSGLEGWSGDQIDNSDNQLRISKNYSNEWTSASKTFDFGAENAGKTVTVTFNASTEGGWESSGGASDFIRVQTEDSNNNKTVQVNDDSSIDSSYSFDAVVSADGTITIYIDAKTTDTQEALLIDNFKIQAKGDSWIDNSDLQNAQLIDGIVEGIEYETSSGITGLTDEYGNFSYKEGDSVTFKVGGVILGVVTAEDLANGQIFLQDIADVERTNLNDEYLENLATFLQSIDSDSGDNIVITQETRDSLVDSYIDLQTATEEEVKAFIESIGKTYVDEESAMDHVQEMLEQYAGIESSEFEKHLDDSVLRATFGTAAIAGISYITSSGIEGITDENGQFSFDLGDTISFLDSNGEIIAVLDSENIGEDDLITLDELGVSLEDFNNEVENEADTSIEEIEQDEDAEEDVTEEKVEDESKPVDTIEESSNEQEDESIDLASLHQENVEIEQEVVVVEEFLVIEEDEELVVVDENGEEIDLEENADTNGDWKESDPSDKEGYDQYTNTTNDNVNLYVDENIDVDDGSII